MNNRVRKGKPDYHFSYEPNDSLEHTSIAPKEVGLFKNVSTFACIAVGIGTTYGLHISFSEDSGLPAWLLPLLAGGALTSLTWAAWHTLFEKAAIATTGTQKAMLVGLAMAVTGAMIGTSASYVTAAIGGSTAMRHHHGLFFKQFETVADEILDVSEDEKKVIRAVRVAEAYAESQFDNEIEHGDFSGTKGYGPKARELESHLARVRRQARDMNEAVEDRENGVLAALEKLREAQNFSANSDDVQTDLAIRAALVELRQAERIHATDNADDTGMVNIDLRGGTAQFTELTENVIDLADDLEQERRKDPIVMPDWNPITRKQAVQDYAGVVSLEWLATIVIESFSFVLLLIVLVGRKIDDDHDESDWVHVASLPKPDRDNAPQLTAAE